MHALIQKRLLDIKAAADYLSLSKATIHRLAIKGILPSLKIGQRRLHDVNNLDDYVDQIKSQQRNASSNLK